MILLLYALCVVCIAATLLPLSKNEAWWIRACDFPRLQIVAGSIVVLGALALAGGMGALPGQVLAVVLVGCIARQLAVILPYTPLWRAELMASARAQGDATLSFLVVNVLMSNRQCDGLFALIERHGPDLVLALETDHWWAQRFERVAPDYRFRLARPIDNTYGLLLYSKLELIDPELRELVKSGVPSVRTGVRLRSGATITLYCLHPEPPSPSEADTSLPRDAELVIVGREIARPEQGTIVAGDLNDVAWSHTSRLFRRISGLLDPRIGRGMFNTFHAAYWLLRWPLDHVFVSEHFLLRAIERLPGFGSDHFPILITLDHAPRAAAVQEPSKADPDDRAEADEKLAQVRTDPEADRVQA